MSCFRFFIPLLLLALLVLTGCETVTGTDDEGPEMNTISIALTHYKAVRDCDAGPGDFEFATTVTYNGSEVFRTSDTAELNDGETQPIGESVSIDAERLEGNKLSVTFKARERDDPLGPAPPNYNDLDRQTTKSYTFGPGGWSDLPDGARKRFTIEVSKAASCKTELSYTVAVN